MQPLLTSHDICDALRIKRTTFDRFKTGLYRFGLHQQNGRGSEYRMKQEDFEKYINSKI